MLCGPDRSSRGSGGASLKRRTMSDMRTAPLLLAAAVPGPAAAANMWLCGRPPAAVATVDVVVLVVLGCAPLPMRFAFSLCSLSRRLRGAPSPLLALSAAPPTAAPAATPPATTPAAVADPPGAVPVPAAAAALVAAELGAPHSCTAGLQALLLLLLPLLAPVVFLLRLLLLEGLLVAARLGGVVLCCFAAAAVSAAALAAALAAARAAVCSVGGEHPPPPPASALPAAAAAAVADGVCLGLCGTGVWWPVAFVAAAC